VTENEKKVKAPAKAKKNAAESAGTEAKSVAKAKTAPGEAKPRAKAANTKEVAGPAVAATSNGPQRVPSKAKSTSATTPTHQQIAQLAHRFWKERGGHHGSHEQDWLRAERELRGKAS
jgi:hypothetical protein